MNVRRPADALRVCGWFRRTRSRQPGWLGLSLGVVLIQVTLALVLHGARLRKGSEDTDLYYRYATATLQGKVPYRDFPVEYPPLALPLFLTPRVVARDVNSFKTAFAIEMLLFHAGTVVVATGSVAGRGVPGRLPARLAWYTLVFLILSRLVVTRYDAAPAFLGFAASVLWFSGRGSAGGLAASLGAMTKVFPGLVALIAVPWDLSRPGSARGRGSVAFGVTAAVGLAAWVGFAGAAGVSGTLRYHTGRGLEYGSLYSGAQMLAAKVLGLSLVISRDHASFSTVTPWSPTLLALAPVIQAATVLLVVWTFVRRGMREGVRYSGAAVLAFAVTGKVFSPQYLLWVLPYLAVLEGPIARRGRWLFAAVCAATLLAPAGVGWFSRTSLWVVLAYDTRNLLVVGLLGLLVFGPPDGDEG